MSTNNTKVARPATPALDLLQELTDQVYLPVGAQKLAAANVKIASAGEVGQALMLGNQVASAIDTAQASREGANGSEVAKVASNVSKLIPGFADPAIAQRDAQINQHIDANAELSAKFAAALA